MYYFLLKTLHTVIQIFCSHSIISGPIRAQASGQEPMQMTIAKEAIKGTVIICLFLYLNIINNRVEKQSFKLHLNYFLYPQSEHKQVRHASF